MKSFVALAIAAVALALPEPQASLPQGCSNTRAGSFQISIVNVTTSKRDLSRRQLSGITTATLTNGKLTDQAGRQAEIVANHQFQFDSPLQNNAIATTGFGICGNNSLTTPSGSAVWYQCLSGTFYNIYDISIGGQCSGIYLVATGFTSGALSQKSDGQPAATSQVRLSQISDGQPQPVTVTGRPLSQISDGQVQAPTRMLSQISDGQPQGPMMTAPKLSQISDGQPQAPKTTTTPTPVSSAAKLSQISDGQPQAPKSTATPTPVSSAAKLSQISDGQVQAPKTSSTPSARLSQISDGQPQLTISSVRAPVVATTTSALAQFTGAAITPYAGAGALAAGIFGLVALL